MSDGKEVVYAVVDDGFRQIKCLTSTGYAGSFASVARAGFTLSGMGQEDAGFGGYETGGRQFTVDPDVDGEDTRFDDYAVSDINRVLVNHALQLAGLAGKNIVLGTGLPFQVYFNGDNTVNEALLGEKQKNLSIAVKPLSGAESPAIVSQMVFAQGLAACIDHVTDDQGNYRSDFDRSAPIAIVDIGGRTTDSVVLLGGEKVDHSVSGTGNVGISNVYDKIAADLRAKFNVARIRLVTIENAVRTGKIRFRGTEHDITEFVKGAVREVGPQIVREVQRRVGDAAEMSEVLLVGGGATLLEEVMREHYPHCVVPKDPEFANARGMLKFIRFNAGE